MNAAKTINTKKAVEAINSELRTMAVTKLAVLALHWAELIVRMDEPAWKLFIARFMRDEAVQQKYLPTIAKAIMEHDWLRASYETLAGIDLNTPANVEPAPQEPTIQYADHSVSAAAFTGEPTPVGLDAERAAHAAWTASFPNEDDPAA